MSATRAEEKVRVWTWCMKNSKGWWQAAAWTRGCADFIDVVRESKEDACSRLRELARRAFGSDVTVESRNGT